jgi:hypothetical protein
LVPEAEAVKVMLCPTHIILSASLLVRNAKGEGFTVKGAPTTVVLQPAFVPVTLTTAPLVRVLVEKLPVELVSTKTPLTKNW